MNPLKQKAFPKDKRKLKTTYLLSGFLLLVFLLFSILLAVFTPRVKESKNLEGESYAYLFEGEKGKTYFAGTTDFLEEKEIEDDSKVLELSFKKDLEEKGESLSLLNGSFSGFDFLYSEDQKSLLLFDNVGNLFKYQRKENGFVLSDDYLISQSPLSYRLSTMDNDLLYICAVDNDNGVVIEEYQISNLSQGPIQSKKIWVVDSASGSSYTIKRLEGDTAFWQLSFHSEYLYLTQKNSGIIKINRSLDDYQDISYYEAFDSVYLSVLKESLNALDQKTKEEYGLTEEIIDASSKTQLERYYRQATKKATSSLRKEAKAKFLKENPWCLDYDVSTGRMTIQKDSFDSSNYSIVSRRNCEPVGIIYSSQNDAFYFGDNLDRKVYAIDGRRLDAVKLESGVYLDDLRVDTGISFTNYRFDSNNALFYNQQSNSLYLKFNAKDMTAIITLDGKVKLEKNVKTSFNIRTFVGDKDNRHLHYLADLSVDTWKGSEAATYLYHANSERMVHKGFYSACFWVFFAFALLALLVFLISWIAYLKPSYRKTLGVVKKDVKKNKWVYLALVPFIVLLFLFNYYEAIKSMGLSFFSYTSDKPSYLFNHFGNYIRLLRDKATYQYIGNMLFFLVFDIFLSIVPPVIFAFFLTVMRSKNYSKVMRTLLYIPGIVPGVASMLIWRYSIFGDSGILNRFVTSVLGLERVEFLNNPGIARWSLILMGFPFVGQYIIFYGGLMNIPKDYFEAAEIDGCSLWKRFIHIDLPLLQPQLKYVLVTTILNSVQNYSRTYMLRSAGTTTLSQAMYEGMLAGDYGLAATYAMLIFVFLAAVIVINFRMQKKNYMGGEKA